jgi:alkylated DNA repair dioxygenase AlkB
MTKRTHDAIEAMESKRPKYSGTMYERTGRYALDGADDSSLLVVNDVLCAEDLAEFARSAISVVRPPGRSAFMHQKPRLELCYTTNGEPYRYSGVVHETTHYPPHVLRIVNTLLAAVRSLVPDNAYVVLSNGVDILYSERHEGGGSIGAHSDDEDPEWGLVLILTLGQTRWLRVASTAVPRAASKRREWHNVRLAHNSLVGMYGSKFQSNFTHQIDRLPAASPVGRRYSLNLRFKKRAGAEVVHSS